MALRHGYSPLLWLELAKRGNARFAASPSALMAWAVWLRMVSASPVRAVAAWPLAREVVTPDITQIARRIGFRAITRDLGLTA